MICDKIISDIDCNTIVQNEEFDENYVYVYIMQLNKSDGNTVSQVFLREKYEEEIKFTIKQDGFYTLCRLIVSKDPSNYFYFKDGKFYKNIQEVDFNEMINTNPEVSNLDITYFYYFQLCKLRKCFTKVASSIINDRASIRCNQNVSNENIYKRDLIWSTLNIISYLTEMEQFEEAERLLERVTGCNGICDQEETSRGCGCGN